MSAPLERLATAFDDAVFEHRDGYAFVSYPSFPIPFLNGMWVDDDSAAGHIDEARADAERRGTPFTILVRDGRTPAVEEAARARGFTPAERMPGMGVERHRFRDGHVPRVEVRPISEESDLENAMTIARDAFELPQEWAAAAFTPQVVALDGLQYYLALVDGHAVATGMGFTIGDAVAIFNVATPASERGHGYGSAVTARAVRDGFERGATYAVLQSSPLGESVYIRLGFEELETYVAFIPKS
jgi:GNAT superfamily N-acetyltransferase